jgi:ATP phosphoribosyltransferase
VRTPLYPLTSHTPFNILLTISSPFLCLAANKYILCTYNIQRTLLDAARQVTPGKRAPSITALEEDGWVAVSAMVEKKRMAPIMDKLADIGATDILALSISNSRSS